MIVVYILKEDELQVAPCPEYRAGRNRIPGADDKTLRNWIARDENIAAVAVKVD